MYLRMLSWATDSDKVNFLIIHSFKLVQWRWSKINSIRYCEAHRSPTIENVSKICWAIKGKTHSNPQFSYLNVYISSRSILKVISMRSLYWINWVLFGTNLLGIRAWTVRIVRNFQDFFDVRNAKISVNMAPPAANIGHKRWQSESMFCSRSQSADH